MIASLRALFDRPIADHERRRAFALAGAVVVIAAAGLLLLGPAPAGDDDQPAATPVAEAPTTPPTAPQPETGGSVARERGGRTGAEAAARWFLGAYLDYLYGRRRVRSFPGASAELSRRLRRQRPRVSPATRRRDPEISELERSRSGGAGSG